MPPWLQQAIAQALSETHTVPPFNIGSRSQGMWANALGTLGQPNTFPSPLLALPAAGQTGGPFPGPQLASVGAPPTATSSGAVSPMYARAAGQLALPAGPPIVPATTPAAGSPSLLSRLGGLSKAKLGLGAGLIGTGGSMAVNALWNDPDTHADEMTAGALQYGGMGAGIGAIGGPIGMGIGGAIGVGAGLLMGANSPDEGTDATNEAKLDFFRKLNEVAEQMNLHGSAPGAMDRAIQQLRLGWTMADADNPDEVKQVGESMMPALVQQMLQEEAQKGQLSQYYGAQNIARQKQQEAQRHFAANLAAVQAWMEPMMQQQLDQAQFYANTYRDAGLASAKQVPDKALRKALQTMAHQYSSEQASANVMALQQMAMQPQMLEQQFAQLAQQQAMEQQMAELSLQEQQVALEQQMAEQQMTGGVNPTDMNAAMQILGQQGMSVQPTQGAAWQSLGPMNIVPGTTGADFVVNGLGGSY